ncbi:phosphatase PAP2 family protein [Ectobacillus panaciterrae]|uniref:phosphatase PAP2 family protein n=1 Tax=Ectobacillus panaciterrae TaxID=363872 RepID=UPI0004050601|nr:phosphatase PAP2 family protein [Ectobacillus panaciterrae]
MKRYINKHTYAIAFILVFLTFAGLIMTKIMNKEAVFVDVWMKGRLQSLQGEGGISFFEAITELGSGIGIVGTLLLSSIWLWRKKRYPTIIAFILAVAATRIVNKVLKAIVARERPSLNAAVDGLGYSFPSGHAMLSIVTYGFLAAVIIIQEMGKAKKAIVLLLAALLILLVGLSRIVLSVHYPSDILGGYCMGGMMFILFLYVNAYAQRWQRSKSAA